MVLRKTSARVFMQTLKFELVRYCLNLNAGLSDDVWNYEEIAGLAIMGIWVTTDQTAGPRPAIHIPQNAAAQQTSDNAVHGRTSSLRLSPNFSGTKKTTPQTTQTARLK
jgi:hypothetical protein